MESCYGMIIEKIRRGIVVIEGPEPNTRSAECDVAVCINLHAWHNSKSSPCSGVQDICPCTDFYIFNDFRYSKLRYISCQASSLRQYE
ncbi:putative aspartate-semialdehyde dehydrogenase [Fusarium oxysporum f. sp. albedinis]|nr:putative aspartate-semialdehyde dehydrogenase [Fusarium oxysporum f. sp. albedinis]